MDIWKVSERAILPIPAYRACVAGVAICIVRIVAPRNPQALTPRSFRPKHDTDEAKESARIAAVFLSSAVGFRFPSGKRYGVVVARPRLAIGFSTASITCLVALRSHR
jgi:hypothetical protein